LASDLYRLDRDYYLVLYTDQNNSEEFSPVLSEYGRAAGSGNPTAAYIAEHGEVIASENAVQRIACCLTA
ncbi:MAG: adaptor protein MecA, partial [Clostridiales bacterium]|nr:adaptor protein MecA [Clostridiales bacterium]